MTDAVRCSPGDWVEVERVLLEVAERAVGLPADTAAQPLRVWVKGYARSEAMIGDTIEVETMTGRVVSGHLSAISPGYTHTFGTLPAEIVHIGRDLRARVAAYRAAAAAVAGGMASPEAGE
jgi:hypothetical protein